MENQSHLFVSEYVLQDIFSSQKSHIDQILELSSNKQ